MPDRLQLQELAKKTLDCSNTIGKHTHTHTLQFSEVEESGAVSCTHKPRKLHNTHIQTPWSISVGTLCQKETEPNSAEWSNQIWAESRLQKRLCDFAVAG